MLKFKRLHRFVLKSFLPLFAMTFFIVLFIVLMQFLWKYVDDLVGKGLEISVIAELFFYAAVSMVPMSLPLAILLASLMTFGNFGEKFELTAMKASGISLLRVMAPLIVFISAIAVGAFFFQNNVLPTAQVKMWTLLFSMKEKSPEVEIPEGVFYDQIPGYNLYVAEKNRETGMLKEVMIYDVNRGGENSTILLSDSARMAFTKDMRYMYLHLYKGEQFENLREQQLSDQNVPFRREEFKDKQILIPFDANFNRMDDQSMRKQYVGKNIAELRATIDSVGRRLDSIGSQYARELQAIPLGGVHPDLNPATHEPTTYKSVAMPASAPDLDSILGTLAASEQASIYEDAKKLAEARRGEMEYKSLNVEDDRRSVRRHEIELIKKFTLSVACLVFFFIGAPLGAIIRKGGIGTPLVISVLLFLVYYIIDNTGYKMARDGRWNVYFGMWISTCVLVPLGVFVTYKAMNDSALFDKAVYIKWIRKILGLRQTRNVAFKEVIINDISLSEATVKLQSILDDTQSFLSTYTRPLGYVSYWVKGISKPMIDDMSEKLNDCVEYMSDCREKKVVAKLSDYPVIRRLWIYHPSTNKWLSLTCIALFPIGIPVWVISLLAQKRLISEVKKVAEVDREIASLLALELS